MPDDLTKNGDATFPTWMSQLSDELKQNGELAKFEKLSDFGNAFLELKGKADNSIAVPGENATEEEIAAFYNRLGRPEKPDGYGFTAPELPKGMKIDQDLERNFKEMAHKIGLTKNQAVQLYGWYNQSMINAFTSQTDARKTALNKAEETLRREWGNDYNQNIELMKRAVEQFGGEDFKNIMRSTGLGNDPVLIKTFYNIGKAMAEDTLITGEPGGNKQEVETTGQLHYPSMEKKK